MKHKCIHAVRHGRHAALAALLAAGLLVGGNAALAAGGLDLNNMSSDITDKAYNGYMSLNGPGTVTVIGNPSGNAFTDLVVTSSNAGAADLTLTPALSFSGGARISGNPENGDNWTGARVIVTSGAQVTFGGTVSLLGGADGGGAELSVLRGSTVTAGGEGFSLTGASGIILSGGTLVGNVTSHAGRMANSDPADKDGSSIEGGYIRVAGDGARIQGNVTIGDRDGAAAIVTDPAFRTPGDGGGRLMLYNEGAYYDLTIDGNLTLNKVRDDMDTFDAGLLPHTASSLGFNRVDPLVVVGAGKTLKVSGVVDVNSDTILALAGTLESQQGVDLRGESRLVSFDDAAQVRAYVNLNDSAMLDVRSNLTLAYTLDVSSPNASVRIAPGKTLTVSDLGVASGTVRIGTPDAAAKLLVTGSADFQANSRLELHAVSEALNVAGTLTVADGSRLEVIGGQAGEYDAISAGSVNASEAAWTGANLTSTARGLAASGAWRNGKYALTLTSLALPGLTSGMNGMISGMTHDVQSPNRGVQFMSRALDRRYMSDDRQAAATIEGAAELAQVGAVPGVTLAASNAGAGAVTARTSFAAPSAGTGGVAVHHGADGAAIEGMSAGNGFTRNGFGLWLMPLYQNSNVWGMKAGDFKTGYNSSIGGLALGADYTFMDMFRIGAALNAGGGYTTSTGDFNSSESHSTFWGVNLYGGWSAHNIGVSVDGGYTGTYSELRQDLPADMRMASLEADVNSRAWHAGLRAEYRIETSILDIIPHVGVRWIGITTDGYDSTSAGGTVFKADESYQSIWTFPVGVTFAKSFTNESGWSFRPQVDAGVIPATGDVQSKTRVRIPGVAGNADMKVQQVDYVTFDGTAGFEVSNATGFSVGLNYNLQLSEHRTGHGLFGTVRYEF